MKPLLSCNRSRLAGATTCSYGHHATRSRPACCRRKQTCQNRPEPVGTCCRTDDEAEPRLGLEHPQTSEVSTWPFILPYILGRHMQASCHSVWSRCREAFSESRNRLGSGPSRRVTEPMRTGIPWPETTSFQTNGAFIVASTNLAMVHLTPCSRLNAKLREGQRPINFHQSARPCAFEIQPDLGEIDVSCVILLPGADKQLRSHS